MGLFYHDNLHRSARTLQVGYLTASARASEYGQPGGHRLAVGHNELLLGMVVNANNSIIFVHKGRTYAVQLSAKVEARIFTLQLGDPIQVGKLYSTKNLYVEGYSPLETPLETPFNAALAIEEFALRGRPTRPDRNIERTTCKLGYKLLVGERVVNCTIQYPFEMKLYQPEPGV